MGIRVVLTPQNRSNPVKSIRISTSPGGTLDQITLRGQTIVSQNANKINQMLDVVMPPTANTGWVLVYDKQMNKYVLTDIGYDQNTETY
jgi:hypothetical protein